MYKSIVYLLIMLILSGCSFFQIRKPIIEQSNVITAQDVSKLSPGMSSSQVIGIMGSPVITNVFTPNRMQYVYTYDNHINPPTISRVTCLFKQGRLKEILKS